MSDLFPVEQVEEVEVEKEEQKPNENENVEMDIGEDEGIEVEQKEEIKDESPFVLDKDDPPVEMPKKKKKRQLTQKQLDALAAAREKSRLKRAKLKEARDAKADAEKEQKRKARQQKKEALAEKKAQELAEIEGYEKYKEKKYSFTKDELNELLDTTIDRHETKRKKRKEEEKRKQQPMVTQPYPYAMPAVPLPPQAYHPVPTQPPIQVKTWKDMTGDEIRESRKAKESKKVEDFMNDYFNIK
jgi:hypothetical protein